MKYTRLVAAALLLAAACQEKESLIPETQHVQLFFGDELSDTKADVDGLSGLTTWGTGDQIAIFIAGAGANAYQTKTVTGGMIPVSLTSGQSRTNYAIYPATAAVSGHHTTSDLQVNYPASYDLSALSDDAKATYSPLPMVAANNTTGALVFYNVGAVLRLTVNSIPAATRYLRFTVPGKNIAGNYTVTAPGTATPTVDLADGASSSVTFQLAAETIGTLKDLTLNLPVPAGNYSAVDYVAIEALGTDGSTVLATTRANATRWTTLSRRKGRKQTSSFAPADFVITSAETTLWKGEFITYAANYPGAKWSVVSGADKISVDATTGEITATAAGVASVKATLNGLVDTPAVNVYVNEVSTISEITADKTTIGPDGTASLSVTITHTENGTITSYPAVTWTSGSESDVTVSPASSTPVYATATTAAATTTATGGAEGSSSITAQVAGSYTTSGSALSANCSITVRVLTTITFPSGGEKYMFRGLYLSPGILKYDGNSNDGSHGYTLTSGSDPFELMQYYGNESSFNVYYHSAHRANSLYHRLQGSTDDINGNLTATITVSGSVWRIPTSSEWNKFFEGSAPEFPITINGTSKDDKSNNYVRIQVDLWDATRANGASVDYHYNNGEDKFLGWASDNSTRYQYGYLLIPDGAKITCAGITTIPSAYFIDGTNRISWEDLTTLTDGGCVFLPLSGYNSGGWNQGGGIFYYYCSNLYEYQYLYYWEGGSNNFSGSRMWGGYKCPVRLVR